MSRGLAVPGASVAAEVKVLMDSGSGITAATAGDDANRVDAGVCGHARLLTSLGQEYDIVTQSCPLHLTIETRWEPVRFTMPFIVLPGGGDVVIIGHKTLREKLGSMS